MNLKVRLGLIFAALGYAIVVAIGVQFLTLQVLPSNLLLWLAPVTILRATEGEPPWSFLLFLIAPMNAALYGCLAIAVASIAQRFSKVTKN
jgi:hypothetical protein